jgi:hypothetical protein
VSELKVPSSLADLSTAIQSENIVVKMFYKLRLKTAFASIGISPDLIPNQLIQLGVEQGQQNGANPTEAMLIMLAQMPVDLQMTAKDDLVRALVHFKKVDIHNVAIGHALEVKGFGFMVDEYKYK